MSRISDLAGFSTALSTTEDLSVGIITASSFSGNLTGTASLASNLTGTPDTTVNNLTGVAATFTGNVSIAGTLTYEDVSNVDSVGLITARKGIQVLSDGVNITGIATVGTALSLAGGVALEMGTTADEAGSFIMYNDSNRFFEINPEVATKSVNIRNFGTNAGDIRISSRDAVEISGGAGGTGDYSIRASSTGEAELYQQVGGISGPSELRLTTDEGGVIITGVCTATSFSGNISGNTTVSGVATATRFGGFDSLVSTASSDKTTYLVTVADKTADHRYFGSGSSSGYFLDGKQSPIVKLTPGKTYFFDQGDSSNGSHPLRFYLESDKTTQYTDGITAGSISAGTAGAGVTVVVGDTTPSVLHYQCSSHGYMGNAVTNDSTVVNTNYDSRFGGFLKESVTVTAGKLSDNTNIDLSNGNLFLFTTAETTTSTPNLRYDGSTSLNNKMDIGETVSVTIVTTAAAAGYAATVNIDGATVGTNSGTLNWTGGSAPDEGGSSGVDIYAYTIMKTASAKYTVIATKTQTS